MIRNWVTSMAAAEAGPDVFGGVVQMMASFFYAGDVLLTWLQGEFDVVVGLFEWVRM